MKGLACCSVPIYSAGMRADQAANYWISKVNLNGKRSYHYAKAAWLQRLAYLLGDKLRGQVAHTDIISAFPGMCRKHSSEIAAFWRKAGAIRSHCYDINGMDYEIVLPAKTTPSNKQDAVVTGAELMSNKATAHCSAAISYFIAEYSLTAGQASILMALWMRVQDPFAEQPTVQVRQAELSMLTGLSHRTCEDATAKLQRAGALRKENLMRGAGSSYTLLRPEKVSDALVALEPFDRSAAGKVAQVREVVTHAHTEADKHGVRPNMRDLLMAVLPDTPVSFDQLYTLAFKRYPSVNKGTLRTTLSVAVRDKQVTCWPVEEGPNLYSTNTVEQRLREEFTKELEKIRANKEQGSFTQLVHEALRHGPKTCSGVLRYVSKQTKAEMRDVCRTLSAEVHNGHVRLVGERFELTK